ncbi:hypothetical protein F383_07971 [Gossypium arboreum]|uniref:Uncharacterized protein n=1 Tax=Gossypium arboreum TaxID=29729 RepID=A0A0B0MWJ7_GOSAR|nr:hypothetical protein F383_09954 [Gossypium arboreum]KHG03859.1 hypothetical protein F383_07971 [Gossypium arboreum]
MEDILYFCGHHHRLFI